MTVTEVINFIGALEKFSQCLGIFGFKPSSKYITIDDEFTFKKCAKIPIYNRREIRAPISIPVNIFLLVVSH